MDRAFEGIWIPAELWLSEDINFTAKVVFLEVRSYDDGEMGCIASNKTIGEPLKIKPNTISLILKKLEKCGYIDITYADYKTFEGRVIKTLMYKKFATLTAESIPPPKKSKGVLKKSIHSINTNHIEDNINVGLQKQTPPLELSDSEKCQLFIDKFNKIKNSKYQPSDSLCKSLKARLKKYSTTQIFTALRNAMATKYHQEEKYRFLTPEFILREKKIELYLNMESSESPEATQRHNNQQDGN